MIATILETLPIVVVLVLLVLWAVDVAGMFKR